MDDEHKKQIARKINAAMTIEQYDYCTVTTK